jgi:hypothetical protein
MLEVLRSPFCCQAFLPLAQSSGYMLRKAIFIVMSSLPDQAALLPSEAGTMTPPVSLGSRMHKPALLQPRSAGQSYQLDFNVQDVRP